MVDASAVGRAADAAFFAAAVRHRRARAPPTPCRRARAPAGPRRAPRRAKGRPLPVRPPPPLAGARAARRPPRPHAAARQPRRPRAHRRRRRRAPRARHAREVLRRDAGRAARRGVPARADVATAPLKNGTTSVRCSLCATRGYPPFFSGPACCSAECTFSAGLAPSRHSAGPLVACSRDPVCPLGADGCTGLTLVALPPTPERSSAPRGRVRVGQALESGELHEPLCSGGRLSPLSERPGRRLQPAGGALELPAGAWVRLLPRLGRQGWRARPSHALSRRRAVLCVLCVVTVVCVCV
jgi:hypothetical protein